MFDIDEKDIRRNAMLAGSALFIVILGEGTFSQFFWVKLVHPEVAMYALITFFFISLWRYWLATNKVRGAFHDLMMGRLVRNPRFRKNLLSNLNSLKTVYGDRENFTKKIQGEGNELRSNYRSTDPMIQLEVIRPRNETTFTTEAQVHFRPRELSVLPFAVRAEIILLKFLVSFRASLDDMTFLNLHGPWVVLVLVILAWLQRGFTG